MTFIHQILTEWPRFLRTLEPDPAEVRTRIRYMERNVGLIVRAVVMALLFYYLFFSNWFEDLGLGGDTAIDIPPRERVHNLLRWFFLMYVVMNAGYASLMMGMSQFPHTWLLRIVFVMSWVDTMFLAALGVTTGGFDSLLFWVFLGLIIRNAISTPDVERQITLNLFVTVSYLLAGFADMGLEKWQLPLFDEKMVGAVEEVSSGNSTESAVLRLVLLFLMTFCGSGVQILLDKQRRGEHEAREYAVRQAQFEATGRLAAEIAHQLKNPLGIINNAAFTLQRTVREGKTITQQIAIIREEVDRSDRIITELMGYARLSEGRIEKLAIAEVLDHALEQVFPPAAKYEVEIQRNYAPALPPLLMQRSHLSEIFMNLLVNARDAVKGRGKLDVAIASGDDYSVIVTIADHGPGIPSSMLPKIFEPYFTTKEKGSGLGLAIVKHNTEIYGGTVKVESELGKGARFTITLPARSLMKIRR